MEMNNESGECGKDVLIEANNCFCRVMPEHIYTVDFPTIVRKFDQELIKCCRVFHQVLTSGSPPLSNPCFFMASVYHWLIQYHHIAPRHRQIEDSVTIARIHSTLTSTDASVLSYFIASYNSV